MLWSQTFLVLSTMIIFSASHINLIHVVYSQFLNFFFLQRFQGSQYTFTLFVQELIGIDERARTHQHTCSFPRQHTLFCTTAIFSSLNLRNQVLVWPMLHCEKTQSLPGSIPEKKKKKVDWEQVWNGKLYRRNKHFSLTKYPSNCSFLSSYSHLQKIIITIVGIC